MRILFLTYYFEPDLCAGSFRNSSLFREMVTQLNEEDTIDVVTTHPNRYDSFTAEADDLEIINKNVLVQRIKLPVQANGVLGQIKSFKYFYSQALKLIKEKDYDLVYASSSRLFTAFLGAKCANKKKAKLYLDIRDIFRETITDVYKNSVMKFCLNILLIPIENFTFKRASHINLVSEGFYPYFKRFKASFSFYTNGIDSLFLENDISQKESSDIQGKQTIVYAGNFGDSQGLDIIIPQSAPLLADKFNFILVGDGGAKEKLVNEIKKRKITNVSIQLPVKREKLLEIYNNADFLFLHLNEEKAFERVLPSKLFEFGAFDKPIIAGVSGFAASFLKKNMDNIIIFKPNDVNDFVAKLNLYKYTKMERSVFKETFSRESINKKMSKSILSI